MQLASILRVSCKSLFENCSSNPALKGDFASCTLGKFSFIKRTSCFSVFNVHETGGLLFPDKWQWQQLGENRCTYLRFAFIQSVFRNALQLIYIIGK